MKNTYKKLESFLGVKDINIINWENFFDFFKKIVSLKDFKDREELNLLLKNFLKETYEKNYNFSEKNLDWLDLSWLDLSFSNFNRSSLWWAKLRNCNLEKSSFVCPLTERADFSGSNMNWIYAHSTFFSVVNLSNCKINFSIDMTGSLFHWCNLENTSFIGTNLSWTNFYQCKFNSVNFENANLYECSFVENTWENILFNNSNLNYSYFSKNKFNFSRFYNSNLVYWNFVSNILKNSNFNNI